jgi:hypothetical protein
MPAYQRRKGRLIAVDDVVLEQIVVAQLHGGWILEKAQIAQQRAKSGLSHDGNPRGALMYLSE